MEGPKIMSANWPTSWCCRNHKDGMSDHDLRSNFVRRRVTKVIVVNRNIYNMQVSVPVFKDKLYYITLAQLFILWEREAD